MLLSQHLRQGELHLLGIDERASDGNQGADRIAGLAIVNRTGHVLPAAAWRTDNQRAGTAGRRDANLLANPHDLVTFADELADVKPAAELAAQLL